VPGCIRLTTKGYTRVRSLLRLLRPHIAIMERPDTLPPVTTSAPAAARGSRPAESSRAPQLIRSQPASAGFHQVVHLTGRHVVDVRSWGPPRHALSAAPCRTGPGFPEQQVVRLLAVVRRWVWSFDEEPVGPARHLHPRPRATAPTAPMLGGWLAWHAAVLDFAAPLPHFRVPSRAGAAPLNEQESIIRRGPPTPRRSRSRATWDVAVVGGILDAVDLARLRPVRRCRGGLKSA